MDDFSILTNRKRAIIALVHSVVFLLIAVWVLLNAKPAAGLALRGPRAAAGLAMVLIFLTVTLVLLVLMRYSSCFKERLYFGFCASSAALGLLRALFGDSPLHATQYLRVLMLLCAVFIGTLILRTHSEAELAD